MGEGGSPHKGQASDPVPAAVAAAQILPDDPPPPAPVAQAVTLGIAAVAPEGAATQAPQGSTDDGGWTTVRSGGPGEAASPKDVGQAKASLSEGEVTLLAELEAEDDMVRDAEASLVAARERRATAVDASAAVTAKVAARASAAVADLLAEPGSAPPSAAPMISILRANRNSFAPLDDDEEPAPAAARGDLRKRSVHFDPTTEGGDPAAQMTDDDDNEGSAPQATKRSRPTGVAVETPMDATTPQGANAMTAAADNAVVRRTRCPETACSVRSGAGRSEVG